MLDDLARHADVVRDLIDVVPGHPPRQDAAAAQAMNGWVRRLLGIDVPLILLDLLCDPGLPILAELRPVFSIEPTVPALAEARWVIGLAARAVEE